MANKITCTCGHSWNKSDSSKKDMRVCHVCGKDNTMKNGGWLDKFDAPQAQNGIEGTMGGLTDKGFNFNPAWGGAWRDGGILQPPMAGADQTVPMYAMGGSLPGSVGFTYARVSGAAPSEGPYAKKTLPSAQNGQEMSFYQHGLDWTPRNISRNGGWLDKYSDDVPEAQKGQVLQQRYSTGPMMGDLAQQSSVPTQAQAARQDQIRKDIEASKKIVRPRNEGTIGPAAPRQSGLSRAWEIATHPVQYFGYAARNQEAPQYFSRGDFDGLDAITSTLNPLTLVDAAANVPVGLYNTGKSVYEGDLEGAAGNLLLTGLNAAGAVPLIGAAASAASVAKTVGKGAKAVWKLTPDLPIATRFRNALNTGAASLHHQGDIPGHAYFGMTPDQVKAEMAEEIINLPQGAYTLDKNMSNNSAPLFWNQAARLSNQGFTILRPGTTQTLNSAGTLGRRVAQAIPEEAMSLYPDIVQAHEDRIKYLVSQGMNSEAARLQKEGVMPQILGSLLHASPGTEADRLYFEFLKNYKPTLDEGISRVNQATGLNFPMTGLGAGGFDAYTMPTVVAVKGNPLQRIRKALAAPWEDYYLGPMMTQRPGAYEGTIDLVNRNSLYYGRHPIPNFGYNISLINPDLAIPAATLQLNGRIGEEILRKKKKGGEVVKDNEGYWNSENWGKPVEINSNKIIMEGVLEPLLGVSDTGDTQMMYPGKNYTFSGTKVVEYPREYFTARDGKSVNRADEYPLEKLDNLLNFTNYNKPKAKNGWLEKYK